MLRLLVLVVLLAAAVFGIRQLACSGPTSSTGTSSGPSTTGENGGSAAVTVGEDGEVTVNVGERFAVGGLTIVITTLAETGTPTGARYPIDDRPGQTAIAGESFYQAFARAENPGDAPARLDPASFFLDADGTLIPVDPARTGPDARSLIHGASFDFILTFLGPAGLDPRLVYRPAAGGTVIIQGVRPPDAVNGTAETASGSKGDSTGGRGPGAA